jgi:hypothetical protein
MNMSADGINHHDSTITGTPVGRVIADRLMHCEKKYVSLTFLGECCRLPLETVLCLDS